MKCQQYNSGIKTAASPEPLTVIEKKLRKPLILN